MTKEEILRGLEELIEILPVNGRRSQILQAVVTYIKEGNYTKNSLPYEPQPVQPIVSIDGEALREMNVRHLMSLLDRAITEFKAAVFDSFGLDESPAVVWRDAPGLRPTTDDISNETARSFIALLSVARALGSPQEEISQAIERRNKHNESEGRFILPDSEDDDEESIPFDDEPDEPDYTARSILREKINRLSEKIADLVDEYDQLETELNELNRRGK